MKVKLKVILLLLTLSCSVRLIAQNLKKEYINPGPGYTQVVVTTSGNVRTIHVSGQVGVGADLESQMRSALGSLKKQLADAGASYTDIIKMNTYIVKYEAKDLDTFRKVRKEVMGDKDMPASTLVGVYSLALKEYLIEIEAVAMVEMK